MGVQITADSFVVSAVHFSGLVSPHRLHVSCLQTFRHCVQDHLLAWLLQQLH